MKGYSTLASAEWTFEASTIEEAQVEFDLAADKVKQLSAMKDLTAVAGLSHEQLSRAQKIEIFKQGSDQKYNSEFFKQNENDDAQGLLDVLVVIDNSGSMSEEQTNLSTKLLPLLTYVSQSDWKIGVVTTDMSDGCLRDVIQKNQANPDQAFAAAIRAGTSGSGIEAGVPQAVSALSPACLGGQSWLRPNSTLAILIVSDEDNCSDGTRCSVAEHNSADYLIDYLSTIRQVGVNAKVFGLIWHKSQSQSQCQTGYRQGEIYSDLIADTGGSWGSICDSDYSVTLQAMSKDLSLILKTQFALKYEPFIETLEVFVNDQILRSGYKISGNVVEFDEAPPAGARISINYKYSTVAPSDSFTIKENADAESMIVYLDGRVSNDFTYSKNERKISFANAPQAREVKVTYKLDGILERNFSVEKGLDSSKIEVTVNDSIADRSSYTYDSNTGNIVFDTAPKDASAIKIKYQKVVGPLLEYPVFGPEEAMASVAVYDQWGTPMTVTFGDRTVIFANEDFTRGKTFVIEYDNVLATQERIDLGFDVYDESLVVTGESSGLCSSVSPSDSLVDISSCSFGASENIFLNFQYVKAHVSEFELSSDEYDMEQLLASKVNFAVLINGEATDKFSIEGTKLVMDGELAYGSIVTVKLYRDHDS